MRSFSTSLLALACITLLAAGCAQKDGAGAAKVKVTKIAAGDDAQKRAQTALINAKPGEVIEFGEGTFKFTSTLSLTVSNVTLRGQGMDKTTFTFDQQGQGTGGEGIAVTSKENFTIEDLGIDDAKGDAIKVTGCKGANFRRVRVGWTGGAQETNGGYGLYPVLSQDILIEDCVVREASDAGVYVGQSENIIVRRNKVERNVAGIEIENSLNADVYENECTDNTGGILVFSLPDLEKKIARGCRVYDNKVVENNHKNFAPKGNIVANVPAGTGIMVLAAQQVEIFNNEIRDNQNIGVSICSFQVTQRKFEQDKGYDPFSGGIYVHDNKITGGGTKPNGLLGSLVASILGDKPPKLPAIVYDGIIDDSKVKDGVIPPELTIRIRNNGDADFVNFDAGNLDISNPLSPKPGNISRDLKPYEGEMPTLAPVKIAGVK